LLLLLTTTTTSQNHHYSVASRTESSPQLATRRYACDESRQNDGVIGIISKFKDVAPAPSRSENNPPNFFGLDSDSTP
jgi:hypothetical protein